ncbi:ABC transporter ATP-binding protein [Loigolactobacillus bifermentans]|jgi:ATP-binding cassette subfamily B protein|uniref:ABC-type multidrug protein lipid transport system, ATPase component n=1 Tax=Loigolactobacillus bifermentans DSM 20003 TaxID=1423726 RepID=A0A0R1GZQ1_9LACO|nr:ABC transporter ATP-binding protein [Loigolactobacillus bifermentans]KRK39867.1 ABC-type multidrug protein lipid transport system, ATPase component [Loigolactobacillus bifermentans DSM 20003]QGG60467.1 ATP-binding cassette domain-containing protein [Loigolactobacillus bifermentans]
MLRLLKRLNRKEWLMIVVSVWFIVIQVSLELAIPDYMTKITNALETSGSTAIDILRPGSRMLLYSLLSVAAAIVVGYFAARVAASFSARLRQVVFDQVSAYSSADINRFSTASLLTRSTNDITQVQTLIAMGMQVLIKAPITAIWAITKIANKNWEWTAATGVAVVILIVMLTVILTLVQPRFKQVQQLTDRLNLVTGENISGIRVVHAYNAEAYQNNKFDHANQELTQTNLFANRVLAMMNPGMSLISNDLTLAVYALGATLIATATGAAKLKLFSNMIVFSSYAMQVIMAFLLLSIIFVIMPRVTVSAARLNEVLTLKSSMSYPTNRQPQTTQSGTIQFEHVSFKFAGAEENAVSDLSFQAQTGDTVAIIGATGSGKSTVLNLLARRYDVSAGRILIDGIDVRDYPAAQLNDKIGYIPQKAVLFSGTIRSNIDFGIGAHKPEKLSDAQIHSALVTAQAADFTNDLATPVAQHGDNFSGGQKQRLAIARAIARRPEILLFDDSFSALDYATDAKLRQALKQQAAQTTQVIVAQRISTIMDADQIIVLDQGQVAGIGTHTTLLAQNQVYQEIAYSQLSKEELAE